jgi:hypothetical protein
MCLGIPGTRFRPNLDGCFRTSAQWRCSAQWAFILFYPNSCISALLQTQRCTIECTILESTEGFSAWVWWRGSAQHKKVGPHSVVNATSAWHTEPRVHTKSNGSFEHMTAFQSKIAHFTEICILCHIEFFFFIFQLHVEWEICSTDISDIKFSLQIWRRLSPQNSTDICPVEMQHGGAQTLRTRAAFHVTCHNRSKIILTVASCVIHATRVARTVAYLAASVEPCTDILFPPTSDGLERLWRYPQDAHSAFLQNAGNDPPDYTATHPRRR